ncbi:MAG TPA: hypothetical protein VLA93_22105 [Pyrinomonadaceae bacterium]|nr:hypothetical protein [Pyrinomonadaceae bacterium]
MRALILILFISLVVPLSSQTLGTSKNQQPKKTRTAETPEEELTRSTRKTQALQLLKETVNSSGSIQDVTQRSLVVSRAVDLVWKHDPEFAQTSISKTFDDLLSHYEDAEVMASSEKLGQLDSAMKRLIATMTRNDARLGASAEEKLTEVRKDASSANTTDYEKLSGAQEMLALDAKRAVEVAGRVLQRGIPITFPQFLYDLRRTDPFSADVLFREGLRILENGSVYRPAEAIYLSAYGFSERVVLLPAADDQTPNGASLRYGVLTRPLNAASYSVDPATANAYLMSAGRYVTKQLLFVGDGPHEGDRLVELLFLVAKLNVYSARLRFSTAGGWQQLKFDLMVRCKNAGVEAGSIQSVTGYAERLANSEEVFQFGDLSSLEKAKDIEDQERRNEVLARGIWNLIQGQRFEEAEVWIKQIDVEQLRETLVELIEYYAGKASMRARNWSEVNRRASRIKDSRIALLLLLDGASDSTQSRERRIAKQFVLEARALVARIPSGPDKAKSLVSLVTVATEAYPELTTELLPEALTAINASEDYDGRSLQVWLNVSRFQAVLTNQNSTLEMCLQRAARVDWVSALNVAQSLNSKRLKPLAVVSVCSAIL